MKNVVVYTSNTCPYCTLAKEYLDEKGVEYSVKNVQKDTEARKELMDMGHMGVPVIVIGDEEIVGFDKSKIDLALDNQKTSKNLNKKGLRKEAFLLFI